MSYEPYKYDPNNPLSEEELDELGKVDFEGFLEFSVRISQTILKTIEFLSYKKICIFIIKTTR